MRRIRYALCIAALAGATLGGSAHADDPKPVCVHEPPDTDFCVYVHKNPPCIDGGGIVAGVRFMLRPCHL